MRASVIVFALYRFWIVLLAKKKKKKRNYACNVFIVLSFCESQEHLRGKGLKKKSPSLDFAVKDNMIVLRWWF